MDFYRNTEKNIAGLSVEKFTQDMQELLAKSLVEIAKSYGLKMDTCAEGIDLQKYGIDAHLIFLVAKGLSAIIRAKNLLI